MSKFFATAALMFAAPLLVYGASATVLPTPAPAVAAPPKIQSLLKAELFRRLTTEREILTNASLDELPGETTRQRYSFYAAMQVKADLARTRRVLTDYTLYAQLVPYVDRTDYSPITRILDVEGGLWKWRMHSLVRFDERGDRWIHYQIVGGHFHGLEGDIFFEEALDRGTTLVYFCGEQRGTQWPPKLVIERGAEIVFGFTAGRMRKYVESRSVSPAQDASSAQGTKEKKSNDGKNLPQPRSRL